MPRRLRRSRKSRGSRTHGWGIQGQHRRSSRKGGKGKAGTHAHKWTPPAPKWEGKRGFKPPFTRSLRTMSLEELDKIIAGREVEQIDLSELGYDKLLGRGRISKPVTVKARFFSKLAIEKIERIGGKAIVEADN
jgi:large subunit ribosomal protein L15